MKTTPGSKPRAQLVLDVICQFQDKRGRSPSTGEIADALRLSRSSIQHQLNKLLRDGCIKRDKFSRDLVVISRRARVYIEGAEEKSKRNAASGRKGRGQDIHSPKATPSLDARIEMVVQMVKAGKFPSHCTDVFSGHHRATHSHLRVRRVG